MTTLIVCNYDNYRIIDDVPDYVLDMLANDFERARGRDWELFLEGLGKTLPSGDFDRVRLRQGEIDRMEREQPDTKRIFRTAFRLFQRRCAEANIHCSILKVIVDTLRCEQVFRTPYNKTARRVSEQTGIQ